MPAGRAQNVPAERPLLAPAAWREATFARICRGELDGVAEFRTVGDVRLEV